MKKKKVSSTESVIRTGIRWVGAILILGPLLMWLFVRLDWLRAVSLRMGPPLVLIGIALLAAERFLHQSKGGRR